ncbi:MAG: hypothetical protein KDC84_11050 [Crocinitomicaceae bacterium]|nr:hypothetical protein [Crocinitomicaceae bacterium]
MKNLSLLILLSILISCNKATNSNIVGQWDLIHRVANGQVIDLDSLGSDFSLVFNSDQTGQSIVSTIAINEFTWDLNYTDQIITVTFNLSGDTTNILVLEKNGNTLKTHFYDHQVGCHVEDTYEKQ